MARQTELRTERLVDMARKSNTSKSEPKVGAKFHDGTWLVLRMKSDESIIGTSNGVIKAQTVRRLPEDQRWCAEEVLNMRGIPSNPVPGAGGDHIPIEANGTKHAVRGEDEHAPAQHRRVRSATLAHPDRERKRRKGIAAGRSMPHNNECRMMLRARMEQNEDGREVEEDPRTQARRRGA